MEALHQSGIQLLVHPPQSPDLNPDEDVWNWLKRTIHRQGWPGRSRDLPQRAVDTYNLMRVDDYIGSILSMPDRIQAIIEAEGGPTKY